MGHRSTVTSPQPPTRSTTSVTEAPAAAPASDLTVSKVLAVAGAGATSAVLGSLLGVAGTVLGAAIGAVLITVGTSLYQRSIDRAKTVVTTRIRSQGGDGDPETVIIAPPRDPADQATELLAPADLPHRSRKRLVGYVVATVLGFAIALGSVTAVEAIKGSTLLRGESGTSVGRVLQGGAAPAAPTPTPDPSSDQQGGGYDGYDGDDGSPDGSWSDGTDSSSDRDSGSAGPSGSATPSNRPSATTQPGRTSEPRPTGGLGGVLGGNGGSSGSR